MAERKPLNRTPTPVFRPQVVGQVGQKAIGGSVAGVEELDARVTALESASTYSDENARDAVGSALVAGSNVSISVNDAGDQITIAAGDGWTYVVLGSDFVISTTAAADVTGFAFTPSANTSYIIEGQLLLSTSVTTTGPRPGFTWPTGYISGVGSIYAPSSATTEAMNHVSAGTEAVASSTGLPVINVAYPSSLSATLVMGASPSGQFKIRLRSEIAASNVTMLAKSWFRYRAI